MKYELRQTFIFEAAHTLEPTTEPEPSLRIHGHTYHAQVSITGEPDPVSGVILDLAEFRGALLQVKDLLDHRLLDEVAGIGPASLENLYGYIWQSLEPRLPTIEHVTVSRQATGDSCQLVRA